MTVKDYDISLLNNTFNKKHTKKQTKQHTKKQPEVATTRTVTHT